MRYNAKVPIGDLWDYVSNTNCIKKDCTTQYIIKRDGKNRVVDTLCPSQWWGWSSYTGWSWINISQSNVISIDKNYNQFSNYYTKSEINNDEVKWINAVFNNSKTATISDAFITSLTCVDTRVIVSWEAESFAYEYEVSNGTITITASDTENITMRLRLVKEKTNG